MPLIEAPERAGGVSQAAPTRIADQTEADNQFNFQERFAKRKRPPTEIGERRNVA
jgi:hypothetical protein